MDENNRAPKLSDAYQPPVADSVLQIRFVGNTAVVADITFAAVDPFQMLAAAEYVKIKAFQMIQQAEMAEAKRAQAEIEGKKIVTTGRLPPPGWQGPESLRGGN